MTCHNLSTTANSLIMSLLEICQWLQDTPIGTGIRESVWWFPLIEGAHVLALALSVGTILLVDLRLMGLVMKDRRVSEISRQIMPWSLAGFIVMFSTGTLLFWCQAVKAYGSVYFRIKILALLLAGLNALIFEFKTRRTIASWDADRVPPLRARMAGLAGMILWTCVITAGRTMAYNF
jgi:hypothetical protein